MGARRRRLAHSAGTLGARLDSLGFASATPATTAA